MSTALILLFLLLGTALGFEVPNLAQKIAQYKYRKKSLVLPPDPRYTNVSVKIVLSLLSGAVWTVSSLFAENFWIAFLIATIFSTAVLITVIDIRIRIIPNELLLVMIAAGIAFQAIQYNFLAVLSSLLCMVAMIVLFTAVAAFVGMDKVGAGDVKLAGAMGIALGYPNTITAVIIMSAAFLIFSMAGILLRKLTLKSMLPFAPFMMTGMVFALGFMIYS